MSAQRRFRPAFGLLAAVLLAAACGSVTDPTTDLDHERERLAQAQAQWQSHGYTDYRYAYSRGCFCAPVARQPITVTVRAGRVVSAVDADSVPQDTASYLTVDGLFGLIDDAIDQDAARLDVTYDSGLGYPTSGFIDRSAQTADEEFGFSATDLQPLR